MGLIPSWGAKILQAVQPGQKKKKGMFQNIANTVKLESVDNQILNKDKTQVLWLNRELKYKLKGKIPLLQKRK